MREPIEVNYVPDGDDWQVTVSGRDQRRTGRAENLITARDRAEELVAELAPEEEQRTVVHLLNGDALAFTSAYLSARLGKPTEPPAPPDDVPTDQAPTDQAPTDDQPTGEQPVGQRQAGPGGGQRDEPEAEPSRGPAS